MAPPPVPCYLRTQRLRSGLSQRDVGALIGIKSGSHISRLERALRPPTLPIALACQVIFDMEPRALFPKLHAEVEEEVMRRGSVLYEAWGAKTDLRSRAKVRLLQEMVERVTRNNPQQA